MEVVHSEKKKEMKTENGRKTISIANIEILTDLAPALQLFKAITLPGAVTYCGVKSLNACTQKLLEYDKDRMEILNRYCKKDEAGNSVKIITDGKEWFDFNDDENKEKANIEIQACLERKVSFEIRQVRMSDIKQISISGELLERLIERQFIIDDL